MNEIDLLIDLHQDGLRQGPGSSLETKKALDLINLKRTNTLNIADIGCGSGSQTFFLAENTDSNIIAIDLYPQFLEKLKERSIELGFQNRIETIQQSMETLQFQDNIFDLIWSEGAIYSMGFEKGVQEWKKFLKQRAYLVVSEISWLSNSRPKELEDYWLEEYPEIDTISNKIEILEKNGYSLIDHFILPPYCWLDNYYKPLQKRFKSFLVRNGNSDLAKRIVETEKKEIEMYEKYQEYYSYSFYIAQKTK